MINIRFFLSENYHFLAAKFSVYLNKHVFVMCTMSFEPVDGFSSSLKSYIILTSVCIVYQVSLVDSIQRGANYFL